MSGILETGVIMQRVVDLIDIAHMTAMQTIELVAREFGIRYRLCEIYQLYTEAHTLH